MKRIHFNPGGSTDFLYVFTYAKGCLFRRAQVKNAVQHIVLTAERPTACSAVKTTTQSARREDPLQHRHLILDLPRLHHANAILTASPCRKLCSASPPSAKN